MTSHVAVRKKQLALGLGAYGGQRADVACYALQLTGPALLSEQGASRVRPVRRAVPLKFGR